MNIKSYLAFPHKGQSQALQQALNAINHCEATPSINKDLLVLVTESKDENQEKELLEMIKSINSLEHLTLVSGFNDSTTK